MYKILVILTDNTANSYTCQDFYFDWDRQMFTVVLRTLTPNDNTMETTIKIPNTDIQYIDINQVTTKSKKHKETNKTLGVSSKTNTIYYGTLKDDEWQGEKQDVTTPAIKAVFQWFVNKMKNECPDGVYQISFPNTAYVLEMRKEKEEEK